MGTMHPDTYKITWYSYLKQVPEHPQSRFTEVLFHLSPQQNSLSSVSVNFCIHVIHLLIRISATLCSAVNRVLKAQERSRYSCN